MKMWENFTYCIKIEKIKPGVHDQVKLHYVTKVNNEKKEFEHHSMQEIKENNLTIQKFKLNRAVDLMNCMICNGHIAMIQPWFD